MIQFIKLLAVSKFTASKSNIFWIIQVYIKTGLDNIDIIRGDIW